MKNSIKNIIKYIIYYIISALILIWILYFLTDLADELKTRDFLYKNGNDTGYAVQSRELDINIQEDKILYEDTIIFYLNNPKMCNFNFFPGKEYLIDLNADINGITDLHRLNSLTGIELLLGNIYLDSKYFNFKDNCLIVKLEYEVEKDYISKYQNTDVLHIFSNTSGIDYIKEFKINLKSEEPIYNLAVENATVTNRDGIYSIDIKELAYGSNIDLRFTSNIHTNNIKESEFYTEKEIKIIELKEKFDSYLDSKKLEICFWTILSCVIFIIVLFNNRIKRVNAHKIEFEELLEPVLAEAVIDGVIGLKELIMTTIIQLHVKGNIKIINNNTLELISTCNLEDYETEIINLIFKSDVIKIDDINNILVDSSHALEFSRNLNRIKKVILEKITSLNLVSKKLILLNNVIKVIALFCCINIPRILFFELDFMNSILIYINVFAIILYIKAKDEGRSVSETIINLNSQRKNSKKTQAITGITIYFTIALLVFLKYIRYTFLLSLFVFVLIFINICTLYLCKNIMLTEQGKEEKNKLLSLKKYIIDYSLIKNRELGSVVIWDEYLAYAVAFSISNKITEQIYEKWYDLNLKLQVFENILKI